MQCISLKATLKTLCEAFFKFIFVETIKCNEEQKLEILIESSRESIPQIMQKLFDATQFFVATVAETNFKDF